MFYLMTHSTHFILRLFGIKHTVNDNSDSKKEGNVLFNNALNTFYIWLYGVRHTVKDHSDRERERGNLVLPLHGILFPISSKGYFICTITFRIAHTTVFVIPVVE